MDRDLLNNPKFKRAITWLAIVTGGVLSWVYALYPYIVKPLLAFITKS